MSAPTALISAMMRLIRWLANVLPRLFQSNTARIVAWIILVLIGTAVFSIVFWDWLDGTESGSTTVRSLGLLVVAIIGVASGHLAQQSGRTPSRHSAAWITGRTLSDGCANVGQRRASGPSRRHLRPSAFGPGASSRFSHADYESPLFVRAPSGQESRCGDSPREIWWREQRRG